MNYSIWQRESEIKRFENDYTGYFSGFIGRRVGMQDKSLIPYARKPRTDDFSRRTSCITTAKVVGTRECVNYKFVLYS